MIIPGMLGVCRWKLHPVDFHRMILILFLWGASQRFGPCKSLRVSENSGTPKSSILIGFSIMNHPIWGTPIFGNTRFSMETQRLNHSFHHFWKIHVAVLCFNQINQEQHCNNAHPNYPSHDFANQFESMIEIVHLQNSCESIQRWLWFFGVKLGTSYMQLLPEKKHAF